MKPKTSVVTLGAAPVAVSADGQLQAAALSFHLPKAAANTVYVGTSGLNKSTLDKVITELGPGDPDFVIATQDASNRLFPQDYCLDGTSGDRVLVTYWVA